MKKIDALRKLMKENKISAAVIPTADPHLDEYIPGYYKFRQHVSGFTGSAGTLVVTEQKAGLWTDGRYYIQAENELSGSGIVLYRASEKETKKIHEFLRENLDSGSVVGIDGRLFSKKYLEEFILKLGNIKTDTDFDPSQIWEGRPLLPCEKAFVLSEEFCGESVASKIKRIYEVMEKESFTHYLVSSPECIMWLLNIRGNDVENTPVMLSYLLIGKKTITIYVDKNKITQEVSHHLKLHNIEVAEYEKIYEDVAVLKKEDYMAADFSLTNYSLVNRASCPKKDYKDIIYKLKCIKNETEIKNIRKAYIKENAALTKAFYEIYNSDSIDECDVTTIIEKYRSLNEGYFSPSFSTIAAYGANAAMMHYGPQKKVCSKIEKKGMLLIDTGGQYFEGTTDTTRTLVMGDLSDEESENLTLVLKGHIKLAEAVFPEGTKCCEIDALARMPLWKNGIDYRCGTGHGVGYMLGVHEGPQRLSATCVQRLECGMTITNEPGVYTKGKYGIRTENHLCVTKKFATEYASFLCFEVLNYCPIGTQGLKKKLLTDEEKLWINEYNKKCRELITPYLAEEEELWLISYTAEI